MGNRPVFLLNTRLQLCAQMVRKGTKLVDVGTDHAYLPVWMAKSGLISRAIAADLRVGPLRSASRNIEKYYVSEIVETRLSDGLQQIKPYEAEDIVIAGMGGELIAEIIKKAVWLKDKEKRLILQPMTAAEPLRCFLQREGFRILEETAVSTENRVYTVMCAEYEKKPFTCDELYPYIGMLSRPLSDEGKWYVQKEVLHLQNRLKGLLIAGKKKKAEHLYSIIEKLKDLSK